MNCTNLVIGNNPRLLLMFSGWGFDGGVFDNVVLEGYDVIAVSDYSDDAFPIECLDGYSEIVVICWSYGVYMGARFLSAHPGLPVTLKVAVNGTLWPVDDSLGIPEEIFNGTLGNLTPVTYAKFLRRAAGHAVAPSSRPIEDLRTELARIGSTSMRNPMAGKISFDRVVVGCSDRIIPPVNQMAAWKRLGVDIIEADSAHLPDFASLIPKLVVNKKRVGERFMRSMATYARNALAQKEIANTLSAKMPSLGADVIEIGVGRGFLTEAVIKRFGVPATFTLVDMLPVECPAGAEHASVIEADAEAWIMNLPDNCCDTLISSSTMQWFNSPATFLKQCARVVRPDGLVALASFGPDTYRELEGLAPRLHMVLPATLERWAHQHFESVEIDTETLELNFQQPSEALRHIRLTGVNALASPNPTASALRLARRYPCRPDGSCTLTYQPIYMILKTPTING